MQQGKGMLGSWQQKEKGFKMTDLTNGNWIGDMYCYGLNEFKFPRNVVRITH